MARGTTPIRSRVTPQPPLVTVTQSDVTIFARITAANPAQATQQMRFALRLRGPFHISVQAGSQHPCSLYCRVVVYSPSSQPFSVL